MENYAYFSILFRMHAIFVYLKINYVCIVSIQDVSHIREDCEKLLVLHSLQIYHLILTDNLCI